MKVGSDALVIFEGMFLHRDGLHDIWDRSVFLDVPFAETARRMAARDGSNTVVALVPRRGDIGSKRDVVD